MANLILLRHGQSVWNAENRFTGWMDVDLTELGVAEATSAGDRLAEEFPPGGIDLVFTSVLTRAVRTAELALAALGASYLPVRRSWRLNERHYGALTGLNKRETTERFGEEAVHAWRRGYRTPPDPMSLEDPRHPRHDPRYRLIPSYRLPSTECLADVTDRMLPYFDDDIAPLLIEGRSVLVVAHGNSLRALMKHLEHISDDDIADIDIPTGYPRVYDLDDALEVRSVRYLGDADEIETAAHAVANQAR